MFAVWVIPRAFFSMHCCLPGCFSIATWLNQDFLAQSLHNKSNIHITEPGLSINCIINSPPSVLGIGYSRSISLSFKLWWFYRFSRKSHLLNHTYCLWTYLAWTESRWNAIRQFQQNLTDHGYMLTRAYYNRSTILQAVLFLFGRRLSERYKIAKPCSTRDSAARHVYITPYAQKIPSSIRPCSCLKIVVYLNIKFIPPSCKFPINLHYPNHHHTNIISQLKLHL